MISLTTWVQFDNRFQHGNDSQLQRVLWASTDIKVRIPRADR